MNATDNQLKRAITNFNNFLTIQSVKAIDIQTVGREEAERRVSYHNAIVSAILEGDIDLRAEWFNFFLKEEIVADNKADAHKAKLSANKEASADILAPIKAAKKVGEFGKWLNQKGNKFRSQHFSKKNTQLKRLRNF